MYDDLGKLSHLDKSKLNFVIWTTTIWTLPGNLAIALHPQEEYAVVRADGGEMYIMARPLVEKVMKIGGVEHYEIVETHPGAFFENMLASHPFLPKTSRLVLADYVTMDSGTGCVHTAPGFGADDYQTCLRYGMDMVVPVDDQGRHTDYAGKYAGMKTEESNPVILADMKESGALFASEEIVHSYPHCWRCKKPIIFRATPQWFCSVESFKDEACAACEDVRWVPAWGKDRMRSMILERTDWCISRQRRWGLPIPVFYCKDCGKPICTPETIDAVSRLFEEKGSNAWFEMTAEEILPEGFTCPHCGKSAGFEQESDTLDGWFDSGSTHFASMERTQGFWPATMYLEGLDQYRGWFQSSLLTAVGALGRGAPFKECVTHGWTVDGQGRAMHKSLGNGVDPAEVFNKYGADLLRLWAGSSDYHVDVRCSDEIFKQLSQNYLKFRNTAKFCLDNLTDFDPDTLVAPADMLALDRWALTRLNALIAKVFTAYDNYEFHVVSHAVNDFCVVELSSFYFDIIKDRLYCERGREPQPPQRPDGPVPDFGRHDPDVRPHSGLHLRRDLAGHAPPHRRRRAQRAPQRDGAALHPVRSLPGGDGPLGPHRRRPYRRQRRTGAGPCRQDHRQEPGGRGGPHRSRRGCLPGPDGGGCSGGSADRVSGPCGDRRQPVRHRPARLRHQVPALLEGAHQRGYRGRSRGSLPPLRRRGEESPRGGVIRQGTPPVEK